MKTKHFFLSSFLLLVFLSSCQLFPPTDPQEVPEWYPSTWTFSQSKMNNFNDIYSEFLQSYNVDHVLYAHFDSLCSHIFSYCSRDITLLCTSETESDKIDEFETNFSIFFNDWWQLFSVDSLDIDYITTSVNEISGYLSADIYLKNTYKYPLESRKFDLGRIQIGVDSSGYLETLWSTVIPQLPIPENPIVGLSEAKDILVDYTYTIYAYLYNEVVTLTREDLGTSTLISYIENNSQNRDGYIKYRLARRFEVKDGFVYIDAITGEILGFKQTTIYM